MKQKNKQKYHGVLYCTELSVLYVCISFRKSYGIYSYLLLSLINSYLFPSLINSYFFPCLINSYLFSSLINSYPLLSLLNSHLLLSLIIYSRTHATAVLGVIFVRRTGLFIANYWNMQKLHVSARRE